MKKSLILISLFCGVQSGIQAEEKSKPETIEIVIKIDKDPIGPNNASDSWDNIVKTAVSVAQQCQECTERTIDTLVNNVCECVKGMVETMKTTPSIAGCISITVKDTESGVAGTVRKK